MTTETTLEAAEIAVRDILDVVEPNDLTEREKKIISIASKAAAKHALALSFRNMEEHFYDGQN